MNMRTEVDDSGDTAELGEPEDPGVSHQTQP